MQRNNIATRFPRQAKLQLVRWREIDGLMPGEIKTRAADRWPELPAVHSSSWRSWSRGTEYADLRAMVCDEERKRTELTKLFEAAGGPNALSDVADSAAYALAAKAMEAAGDDVSVKEIRTLMATVRDAKSVAADKIREEYDERIRAIEDERAAAAAQLQADNAAMFEELQAAEAEVDRLTELCLRAGIDTSGVRKGELSEAARERIKQIYGIKK